MTGEALMRPLKRAPTTPLLKYTPPPRYWMTRYSGLLITPHAIRGGAALEAPPETA